MPLPLLHIPIILPSRKHCQRERETAGRDGDFEGVDVAGAAFVTGAVGGEAAAGEEEVR